MPDSVAPLQAPQAARPSAPTRVATGPVQSAPPAKPAAKRDQRPKVRFLDVSGAFVLVLLGAFAVSSDLTGPLRLLVTLPVLVFAPGYLVIQAAVVPPAKGISLARQLLAAVGISPAIVALFALSTALVAGAFKEGVIVAVVTVGSLVLTVIALQRRRSNVRAPEGKAKRDAKRVPTTSTVARPAPPSMTVPAPAEAARAKSGTARP